VEEKQEKNRGKEKAPLASQIGGSVNRWRGAQSSPPAAHTGLEEDPVWLFDAVLEAGGGDVGAYLLEGQHRAADVLAVFVALGADGEEGRVHSERRIVVMRTTARLAPLSNAPLLTHPEARQRALAEVAASNSMKAM